MGKGDRCCSVSEWDESLTQKRRILLCGPTLGQILKEEERKGREEKGRKGKGREGKRKVGRNVWRDMCVSKNVS